MFKKSFMLLFQYQLFSLTACGNNRSQTNFNSQATGIKEGRFKISAADTVLFQQLLRMELYLQLSS